MDERDDSIHRFDFSKKTFRNVMPHIRRTVAIHPGERFFLNNFDWINERTFLHTGNDDENVQSNGFVGLKQNVSQAHPEQKWSNSDPRLIVHAIEVSYLLFV